MMSAMTLSGTSGSIPRWRHEDTRKRDRRASLRYGRPGERSPQAPWHPAEQWIRNNGAFLGEILYDLDPESAPPWERPGAVRLAMLSSFELSGGVIIDNREVLGMLSPKR
jgi:hypothetical protein